MLHFVVVRVAALAVLLGNNAISVELHAVVVGVHCDAYRLLDQELFHALVRHQVLFKAGVVMKSQGVLNVGVVLFAAGASALVALGVNGRIHDTVLLSEVKGVKHPAAIAGPVDLVAVHQVLHGVVGQSRQVKFDGV